MTLVTSSGGTISGRVVSDTGEALSIEQKMRITARPVDPPRTYSRFDSEGGRVGEDLTFELKGVFGANRLSIGPLPRGWALKSIQYEGKDIVDSSIDTDGRRVDGVTFVLSKSLPEVRGTLTDAAGRPVEGTVLLFPEEASKWEEESRLIKSTRPGTGGGFEFDDVIPGDYLVAAREYIRTGDWADPAFLEDLRATATRVRVEEGGTPAPITLTLNVAR